MSGAKLILEAKSEILIKRGDIVWGKVRGFSWWPAKVHNGFLNLLR
jgi:hypothetical protein